MNSILSENEQKLIAILRYAPVGLVEVNQAGIVSSINIKAAELLEPIANFKKTTIDNIFPLLDHIATEISACIKEHKPGAGGGLILQKMYTFAIEIDGATFTKHFNIVANEQIDRSIMISIDDFTDRHMRDIAMQQAEIGRAVEQGKYEIASGILHDIGNAVVSFGSYLTRTNRLLEQSNLDNLQNLATFFASQQTLFAGVLGNEKAKALTEMVSGISKVQNERNAEIRKSISDQLNIIGHIQEILDIQRQYVSGHELQERKQVNLRSVINDCMSMLFASIDKRGVAVALNIESTSAVIKGDRTKLMQVILNVLKNSLEAIDPTSQQKNIEISLSKLEQSVVLIVSDTGKGFDEHVASRLFERHFTTKSSGSGIGLYNCKNIVESHAGVISLTSGGPGKGAITTIEFFLN